MITIEQAKAIAQRVFRHHPSKRFAVRLWDGSQIAWPNPPDFALVFRDPETFETLFTSYDPALFAEAFVEKRLDIEGDLFGAVALTQYLRKLKLHWTDKLVLATQLRIPKTRHTRTEDTRDVQAHYDLSNDFYRLFLDHNMIYSSAYFMSPEQTLEAAQEQKLDLICRKLQLKPNETFLDIGCGWGALLLWAAEHYGVRGYGITLSKNQLALARERAREAGLVGRVRIELRHYSELPKDRYDKIASIGMYEHVGIAKYPDYFGTVYRALKSDGLFLNAGITVRRNLPPDTGGAFIHRHVFPGSELPDISTALAAMEEAGFEVLTVESFRWHYARTLREWMRRFTEHEAEMAQIVPERILRIWKLYLPGCASAFEEGLIGDYQVLLAKAAA